jgi:hypothetical protein
MDRTIPIIGIATSELRWIRMLVSLLRHPDPSVPELARQALVYLTDAAGRREAGRQPPAAGDQAAPRGRGGLAER